jgi:membrane-bound metal-dependent hydrolase YbcI (DUF457 family)
MPSPIGHTLAGVAIALAVPDSWKPVVRSRRFDWKLAGTCALFASLPDIDLLYMPIHRTATHSIPVAILVTIIAVAVTAQVNRGQIRGQTPGQIWGQTPGQIRGQTPGRIRGQTPGRIRGQTPGRIRGLTPGRIRGLTPIALACGRIGLAVGLAWSSHVLMDWLGADANPPYGIQMFWPFSDRWYVSGWNVFAGTERRDPLGTRAMLINLRAAVQELAVMGSIVLSVWATRRRMRSLKPEA